MELDATTPGNRKRAYLEVDQPDAIAVTPVSAAKRRKLEDANGGSPSTPKALSAIASAISGVFSFGSKPKQPPLTEENVPPTNEPINVASKPAAVLPNPLAQRPMPGLVKSRPAIKLAALRGTVWDKGDLGPSPSPKKGRPQKAAVPKKATPGKGRGRKPKPEDVLEGLDSEGGLTAGESPSKPRSVIRNRLLVPNGPPDNTDDELSTAELLTGTTPLIHQTTLKKRLEESRSAQPTPKGILTPSKKRGRPPKSVTFNRSIGAEVFFEDIPKTPGSTKGKPGRKPKQPKVQEPVTDADEISCAICSRPDSLPPNEIILCDNCDFAVHQECYEVLEIPAGDWLCKSCAQEDVLNTPRKPVEVGEVPSVPIVVPQVAEEIPDIPNLDQHLRSLQRVLLDRCAGRRRIRMFGQQEAYEKAHHLVEQTVVAGEGNSMLVIGGRGSGKTTLVENIISDLSRGYRRDFHVVRLNGFIHTDDKLALKDIWRQLGKEMQVEDDLLNRSNYADTMASLLALLSHPSEILGTDEGITSQSVIFIIDEFDMFAAHPRQTLLYNLFDIAQSRKAPIAVLGCTTRLDVVEMLEKRVKSRFSHRYIYLSMPKSLPIYWQVCRQGLMMGEANPVDEGIDTNLEGYGEFQKYWTRKIEELYKQRAFQDLLQYHYYTTKSPSAFFTEWILPLSSLSSKSLKLAIPVVGSEEASLAPPDSRMQLVSALSDLDLGMLIAAARLDIVADTDTVNFAMAYDEYSALVGRQRVQSATSGMLAVGGGARIWSRGVAGIAWERLISLGLLTPAGVSGGAGGAAGGGAGAGAGSRTLGHAGLDGKMWKVDVSLEEIPAAVKLSAVLAKWCKEI